MAIKVTVKMDGVGKKLDAICKNQQLGQYLADQGAKFMNNRYVPVLSTKLVSSYVARPFVMTWNTPYARYQYYGENFHHTKEGTQAKWDKPKTNPKAVAEYLANEATKKLKSM